jgi:class 3 adenylate cyclase
MAPIAESLRRYGERILFRHTWGDALHLVTEDALTTAEVALAIRARIDEVRRRERGALKEIDLRLAAHHAPVTSGYDPIEDTPMYCGSQIAFAARVEPVTPPGMVFVTEAFAARLALEGAARFALEYAGEIELAKRYGRYRLFSLRRADRTR